MGADAQDYNNDGHPDLIVTALTGENFPAVSEYGQGRISGRDLSEPPGIYPRRAEAVGAWRLPI